jgi:5-methylcytosine-specific restriction enzyme B
MINWKDFHSYRVFDEFIERFVIEHYSYITKHSDHLDFDAGLSEIKTRFIDNYDVSKEDFEVKLAMQFDGASGNARIIFTNIEYFWCMAMSNITPWTKRSYVLRWFSESDVNDGDRFFFSDPHTIADPGQWNNRNKFAEGAVSICL